MNGRIYEATTAPTADPASDPERQLSPGECRSWLASHHEGRLGYLSGRGPRSVIVTYTLARDKIIIRLPEYNEILQYAPNRVVALRVDGASSATVRRHDTVTVTGRAHACSTSNAQELDSAGGETWPVGIHTAVICLPLNELAGTERSVPSAPRPHTFGTNGGLTDDHRPCGAASGRKTCEGQQPRAEEPT